MKEIKILISILIALSLFGCGKSDSIDGVYEGNAQTLVLAKDGTFYIKTDFSKTIGSYSNDEKSLNIIVGSSVTSYNYSFSNDKLILVANGQSSGEALTKTEKGPSKSRNEKQNPKDLIGNVYETNNSLSKGQYYFASDAVLFYTDLFGNEDKYNYTAEGNKISIDDKGEYLFEIENDTLILYNDSTNDFCDGDIYSLVEKRGVIEETEEKSINVTPNEDFLEYFVDKGTGEVALASGTSAGYIMIEEGEIGWITPKAGGSYVYESPGLFDAIGTVEEGCILPYYEVVDATNGMWYNISKNGSQWLVSSENDILPD